MKMRWLSLSMPWAFGSGCSGVTLDTGEEDAGALGAEPEGELPPLPLFCVHAAASVMPAATTIAATAERRRAPSIRTS